MAGRSKLASGGQASMGAICSIVKRMGIEVHGRAWSQQAIASGCRTAVAHLALSLWGGGGWAHSWGNSHQASTAPTE